MRLPKIPAVVVMMVLSGCASYPTSSVSQGAADAGIWISGAPAGAQIRVAGTVLGPVISFGDSRHVAPLEPGRHEVEIVSAGGEVVSRQVVVLSAGAKYEVRVR
jgi:hypothetical protein